MGHGTLLRSVNISRYLGASGACFRASTTICDSGRVLVFLRQQKPMAKCIKSCQIIFLVFGRRKRGMCHSTHSTTTVVARIDRRLDSWDATTTSRPLGAWYYQRGIKGLGGVLHRSRLAGIHFDICILARDFSTITCLDMVDPGHHVHGSRISLQSIVHFSHGALEVCPAALWLGHDIIAN
jgi:hypothetical protein